MHKKSNMILTAVFIVFMFALTCTCWLKPETVYSESERRVLASKPDLSISAIASGEFMTDFESYTTDQFPFREHLRMIRALFSTNVLGRMETHQLYTYGGHIAKMEYPESPEMIDYAVNKLNNIYNKYLKDTDCKIYLSIVPDKNCFLAPQKGMLSLDYPSFIEKCKSKLSYMEYIDIVPLLSADDYYLTDSHWKQENILDVAVHLGDTMGTDVSAEYEVVKLDLPFKGVYAGQSALPVKGDSFHYLTNDTLKNAVVTYYDTGMPKEDELYNMEKAHGKDPYEMFLSGTSPFITIENQNAKTQKELILLRDSFGSSLAPLFAEGYSKITIVDIRYIQSDFLGNLIDFNHSDVLFLYSTTLLNNSTALR